MATASPQQRVLATAASQIGYSRWSDSKNGTKYARETQPVFWSRDTWLLANGISYCDLFVTWVFWKALGKNFVTSNALPGGASYNTDYRASKGGRVSKPPRPGDVLVFDWNWATASTNHVGILEKVLPSGNYQTIEGNTSTGSSGSQSNGGRVARRTRRPGQVRYVLRPNWSKAGGSSGGSTSSSTATGTQPWESSKTIAKMPKGTVKGVQRLLQELGYSLGSYGVDGSYGESTYNAVRKAQKALGVTVDGVAGPKTIAALKKASTSKPATKPAGKAPAFPLPRKTGALYYYGPASGPKTSVSGKSRNTGTSDVVLYNGKWHSKGLRVFQKQLGISADGRYGDQTEKAVKALQKKHGLTVDGKVGPETWTAAWS